GLSVSYNQAANQVTLKAAGKVKLSPALQLTVIGAGSGGIAKITGLGLAGSGGQPGTNYMASVTGKKVTHTNAIAQGALRVRTALAVGSEQPRAAAAGTAKSRHALGSPQARFKTASAARPGGPLALPRATGIRDAAVGILGTLRGPSSKA